MEKTLSIPNLSTKSLQKIFCGFLLMTVCSFIRIPFYPVPFTLHTFAVAFLGLAVQPKRAFLSVVSYLLLIKGHSFFLTPLSGYFLAMPFAAYAIGVLRKRFSPFWATLAGQCLVYAVGICWLSFWIDPLYSDVPRRLVIHPF